MAPPNVQELMERVQIQLDNRSALLQAPEKRMKPFEPFDYSSRQVSQEIAAVEICPAHPKYMVIGTYSLVKKDDDKDYPAQIRKGTLLVMPVSPDFHSSYPGQLAPYFDKQEFPCAILDVHFHPSDPTLLGVATSNGQMHFYRFVKQADVIGRQLQLKLLPLGSATIAANDEHGLVPLITQFTWLLGTPASSKNDEYDQQSVALIATTSLHEVILVQASLPAIKTPFDGRLSQTPTPIAVATTNFTSHTLEAWTIATSVIKTSRDTSTFLVLSGGDDSALIASLIELGPTNSFATADPEPPQHLFTDTKSHTAGVVAILPLTPLKITDSPISNPSPLKSISPILTGSYDESLRLFSYDPATSRKKLITQAPLGGGVWRLKLMDEYIEGPAAAQSGPAATGTGGDVGSGDKFHFLLLASCMHAGAKIIRLTYLPHFHALAHTVPGSEALLESEGWTIEVAAQFSRGHESMVYGCDFRQDDADADADADSGPGAYTVVSTSFYDKQVCVWGFVDEVKRALRLKGKEKGP